MLSFDKFDNVFTFSQNLSSLIKSNSSHKNLLYGFLKTLFGNYSLRRKHWFIFSINSLYSYSFFVKNISEHIFSYYSPFINIFINLIFTYHNKISSITNIFSHINIYGCKFTPSSIKFDYSPKIFIYLKYNKFTTKDKFSSLSVTFLKPSPSHFYKITIIYINTKRDAINL